MAMSANLHHPQSFELNYLGDWSDTYTLKIRSNDGHEGVTVFLNRAQLDSLLFSVDSFHSSLVNAEQELADYYESMVLDQELERAQLGE